MSNKKIIKGISATWVLSVTRILNGLVLMPLYYYFVEARLLGAWLLFVSLSSFLLLSDLGLALVLSRTLAWHRGLREGKGNAPKDLDSALLQAKPADIYRTVSRAYWALGLAVLVLGGAVGWTYLGTLDLNAAQLHEVRGAWLIYAAGVCFVLAGSAPNYALSGLGDVALESMGRAAGFVLTMSLSALMLWLGYSLLALALVFLFQTSAVRLVLAWMLKKRHAWLFEGRPVFRKDLLRKMLALALPVFVTQLGALFVFQVNPLLIVSALGTAALPDYNAMLVLAMYGGQIAMAIPQTLMPFVAAKKVEGDHEGIRRMLILALKSCMVLILMYAVLILVFGKALLSLWIGPGHYLGLSVMAVMVLLYSLEFHHQAHSQFAFGVGRWPYAKISILAGVLNVLFVWMGLRQWGLWGAAAGTALAQLLTNNWYVPWTVLQMLGLKLKTYFFKVCIPVGLHTLGVAATALFVLWLATRFPLFSQSAGSFRGVTYGQWAATAAGIFAAAGVGLAGTWKFLFSTEERDAFRAVIQRKRSAI